MTNAETLALAVLLVKSIPTDLSSETVQGWLNNPEAVRKNVRKMLIPPIKWNEKS